MRTKSQDRKYPTTDNQETFKQKDLMMKNKTFKNLWVLVIKSQVFYLATVSSFSFKMQVEILEEIVIKEVIMHSLFQ